MASDTKKTVEIGLKITGFDKNTLKSITTAFTNLQKTVEKTQLSIEKLGNSLKNLKVPPTFIKSIDSLKQLNDIKAPNIKNLSSGLKELMSIKFSGFNLKMTSVVVGLKQLNAVKVPNILQLANGLSKLMKTSFSGFNLKITTVVNGLKRLVGIKVPNILQLANALSKLMKTSFSGFNLKITSIATALTKLQGISVPSITGLANGLKKLVSLDVGKVAAKIRELSNALKELGKQGFLKVFATFARDLNNLASGFNKATTAANRASRSFKNLGSTAKDSGLKLRTFGDKIRTVLEFRSISAGILQVRDAITSGVTAIIEYDQALKDLQAITRASGLEVSQMGAKILEVAATTKFSASEVAAGMRIIGQAGFSASESIETMQAVSDLATGTLSSMASTVDLVTTAMRVYNIESSRSNEVADVFANAVNRSKLTIDKLRTSMNFIGPVATAAGVSFAELNAAMGTLANSGIRASTIGTGLRRIFAELIDPSEKLKKAARQAGIALSDLDPRSASLTDVFKNLKLILADTGVAFDIFGKRGAAAALALAKNPEKYQEMLEVISESGTAADMAATQMEGLGVAFKNLRDRLGNLAIALGEAGLTDILRGLVVIIKNLIIAVTALVNSAFGQFLIRVVAISAAIYGLTKAFLILKVALKGFVALRAATAFGTMIPAVHGATVAVGGLSLALGPLIIAVAAVTLGLGYMFKKFGASKKASDEASILADEYGRLSKQLLDYRIATVNLATDSKEYAEANKTLRAELLEVAQGVGSVAEKAREAALSINPLTGEIANNGEALAKYKKEIETFQITKIVEGLNKATEHLEAQSTAMSRWVDRWKDAAGQIGIYLSSTADQISAAFDGNFREIPGMWAKAWKDASKRGAAFQTAQDFSKAIAQGKKSFDEIAKYANELGAKFDLTSSEKSFLNSFKLIQERGVKAFKHLQETGQIDIRHTVEQVEATAKGLNLSKLAVEAVVRQFKELKKASSDTLDTIIDKWTQQKDQGAFVANYIDEYKALGGVIDETNQKEYAALVKNAELREDLIKQLQEAKDLLKTELTGAGPEEQEAAYKKYYTTRNVLVEKARVITTSAAKNELTQTILALKRISTERDNALKLNEVKNANSVRIRMEDELKIIAEFERKKKSILEKTIDPKVLLADTKEEVTGIEAEYATLYSKLELEVLNHKKTEKEAAIEKSALLQEEANKIVAIWAEANKKIIDQDEPDSPAVRAIRKAQLDAQIALGKAKVKAAKDTNKAIMKEQKDQYKLMVKEVKNAASDVDKEIAEVEMKAAKGLISGDEAFRQIAQLRLEAIGDQKDAYIKLKNVAEEFFGKDSTQYLSVLAQLNKLDVSRTQILISEASANRKLVQSMKTLKNERALMGQEGIIEEAGKGQSGDTELIKMTRIFEAEKTFSKLKIQQKQDEIAELQVMEGDNIVKLAKLENDLFSLRQQQSIDLNAHLKAASEERMQVAEEEWRRGIISAEEYSAAVKEAFTAGAIGAEELRTRTLASTGSMWENFQEGTYQAMEGVQSLGEFMQGAGAQMFDSFGNGMADAFSSFLEGTKSAKEAMSDFAKSFLIEIQRMIVKQLVFNALKSIASYGMSDGGLVPSFASGGRIPGNSPTSTSDNIRINATAGEFMHPVKTVKHYGEDVMELLRRRMIPKALFTNALSGLTTKFPTLSRKNYSLASGGSVPSTNRDRDTVTLPSEQKQPINIINVTDPREVGNYLATSEGTNALMNVLSSKAQTLKRILR